MSGISLTHRTKLQSDFTLQQERLDVSLQTYLNFVAISCSFKCSLNTLRFLKVSGQFGWLHCGDKTFKWLKVKTGDSTIKSSDFQGRLVFFCNVAFWCHLVDTAAY